MSNQVPSLNRGQRTSPAQAAEISEMLVKMYDSGSSVRDLRDETGYSLGRIRRLLIAGDVKFRPRGGRPLASRKKAADGKDSGSA